MVVLRKPKPLQGVTTNSDKNKRNPVNRTRSRNNARITTTNSNRETRVIQERVQAPQRPTSQKGSVPFSSSEPLARERRKQLSGNRRITEQVHVRSISRQTLKESCQLCKQTAHCGRNLTCAYCPCRGHLEQDCLTWKEHERQELSFTKLTTGQANNNALLMQPLNT